MIAKRIPNGPRKLTSLKRKEKEKTVCFELYCTVCVAECLFGNNFQSAVLEVLFQKQVREFHHDFQTREKR